MEECVTFLSFFILIFNFFNIFSCQVELENGNLNINTLFEQGLTDKFFINSIKFNVDIKIDFTEQCELLNFAEHKFITKRDLELAVANLQAKNKFKKIKIIINPALLPNQYDLIFDIESFWTLAKVKMGGTFFSGIAYKQFYLLQPTDKFDQSIHNRSLLKIKNQLSLEGYLDTRVIDRIKYDFQNKLIYVFLKFENLNKFTIDSIDLVFKFKKNSEFESNIQNKLKKICSKELIGSNFSKEKLRSAAILMKKWLEKKGFWGTKIYLLKYLNKDKFKIRLKFEIEAYSKHRFKFLGNQFFSSDYLFSKIKSFDKAVGLIPPQILTQEIEALYKKQGFWNAQVALRQDGDDCFFMIKEDNRAVIENIELVSENGSAILADNNFLNKICFKELLKNKFYNGALLKNGIVKAYRFIF